VIFRTQRLIPVPEPSLPAEPTMPAVFFLGCSPQCPVGSRSPRAGQTPSRVSCAWTKTNLALVAVDTVNPAPDFSDSSLSVWPSWPKDSGWVLFKHHQTPPPGGSRPSHLNARADLAKSTCNIISRRAGSCGACTEHQRDLEFDSTTGLRFHTRGDS